MTEGGMLHVARIFAGATVILAPHGGTLANLVFSRSSSEHKIGEWEGQAGAKTYTHVLEILPANRPNLCYERLCRSLGIKYMGLVLPDTSHSQPMRVDIVRVLTALDSLLEIAP